MTVKINELIKETMVSSTAYISFIAVHFYSRVIRKWHTLRIHAIHYIRIPNGR